MDNQRLMIWAGLGLMGFLTYQTWLQDYAPQPVASIAEQPQTTSTNHVEPNNGLPELSLTTESTPAATVPQLGGEQSAEHRARTAPTITVVTDVLLLEISAVGGTIESATALHYPVAKDEPDKLVQLLSPAGAEFGLIQTGLQTVGDEEEPNHLATLSYPSNEYRLEGNDELIVPMRWQNEAGIAVVKRFRFKRGSYAIEIEQEVTNNSAALWRGAAYSQLQRPSKEHERSMFDVDSYSFTGPIIYDGEKSEKLKRDDLLEDGDYQFKTDAGWYGSIQHHFLSVIIPEKGTEQSYRIKVKAAAEGDRSTASAIGATLTIAPGSSKTFKTTVFVGPKLQSQLGEIDDKLKLTVDYGWLTILSNPLFMLLSFVFGFFGNWGVAIIVVTFLIKLVFYKLTESSGRSMAKMRNLQPRMKALQDRYKDDRQALSQAMMELYKREKVNPAAGCLPILIQMPFFLAFYWVLLESVEMRQAPFALWITDLSTRDPFFILPLIMGAAMLMQQRLNPAPADPVQAKVMQIMPIMFTGFFAFFPSGLVLYWVTNTVLSIAQQWNINKVVEREASTAKHGKKS
jgi:YidC/Oxa1 family membrane protein insertase